MDIIDPILSGPRVLSVNYDIGRTEVDRLFTTSANQIFCRTCRACLPHSRTVYYKRLTPVPPSLSIYDLMADAWISKANLLGVDFNLFSSYADALQGVNPWIYCNYDEPNVGFPR